MIRFRLYLDKDKETEWLNKMVSEGWGLQSFFAGFYKFTPREKGEYIYQIDLGDTLYTDVDSELEHYRKIRRMFKGVTIIELIGLFAELFARLTGNDFGWVFALLIGIFVIACVNAVFRTNEVIARLEEQKSGIVVEKKGGNTLALIIIAIGLLANSFMLLLEGFVSPFISYPVHIFAVVMMAAGIVLAVKEGK